MPTHVMGPSLLWGAHHRKTIRVIRERLGVTRGRGKVRESDCTSDPIFDRVVESPSV